MAPEARGVVDAHVHVVEPELPGMKPTGGGEDPLTKPLDALAAHVAAEMRAAGVSHALAMGRLGGPADDPLGVNGTLRLAATVPGLRAIGVADPRKTPAGHPAHFLGAERQLATGKVVALKAYLGYLPFGPDHPGYAPYYALAAKYKVPVVFHTGDTWSTKAKVRFAHPLPVDDVAVDHPEVRFVLAHFGNPWLVDAAEVVFKNENVWADLSGLLVGDADEFRADAAGHPPADSAWARSLPEFRRAYDYVAKPDRLLYGSDWPLAPMAGYRKFVESFIPAADRTSVFSGNARALFRLD